MVVDGKDIAESIYRRLQSVHTGTGMSPSLGILMSGGDAATESFIKIKSKAAARLGVMVFRYELTSEATTKEALAALAELSSKSSGVIVQLPLSSHIDADAVIAAIPTEKDVDAIAPGEHSVLAPVAAAVQEILLQTRVAVHGARAVVVGAGRLVGKPSGTLLEQMGARVHFVTQEEGSLDDLKDADIVVLGVGSPGFIKPEMLKPGVALIDAGTSEAVGGKLMGDADPSCANMASVFTPVPGGVGPVAIAMIFKNLFDLAQKHHV